MDKLHEYINLIVKIGVNIRAGQKLLIWCSADTASFAGMAMEAAYSAGADNVEIYLEKSDPDSNLTIDRGKEKRWIDDGYRMLWLYAPDPKSPKYIQWKMPALPWTFACVPTPNWAGMVFPHKKYEKDAVDLLWESIFAACRINENNTEEIWLKHINTLQAKVDALMKYSFRSLRLKNSLGTDLFIDLPHNHVWLSCVNKTKSGDRFIANIPTEEVFTAPLRTGVNGVVYASRPFVFMGETINGIRLEFENGKIVGYSAKKNQHLLEKFLASYKNANYLGEVALVPHSSPISRMNLFWYESSFDENASCHIAFGHGYPQTIKDTSGKDEQKLLAMELNQSPVHEDLMIGTADTEITGTTQNNHPVSIFSNGEWRI